MIMIEIFTLIKHAACMPYVIIKKLRLRLKKLRIQSLRTDSFFNLLRNVEMKMK